MWQYHRVQKAEVGADPVETLRAWIDMDHDYSVGSRRSFCIALNQ